MDNEANILRARGQLDAAIELLQETERVFREMNDPEALLISLANQASLLGGFPERRRKGKLYCEGSFVEHLLPNREALDKILRYEPTIERSLGRALDRLERLQRRRKGESALLQTPPKEPSAASALGPKKPPQPDRSLPEAQADSAVVNQAVGSAPVTEPQPVTDENEVEQGEEEVVGKEDPDRPGYIELS